MNETYFPPLTHIYLLIMNLFTLAGIAPTDRTCSHAMESRGPSVLIVVSAALSLSLPLLAPLCVGEPGLHHTSGIYHPVRFQRLLCHYSADDPSNKPDYSLPPNTDCIMGSPGESD